MTHAIIFSSDGSTIEAHERDNHGNHRTIMKGGSLADAQALMERFWFTAQYKCGKGCFNEYKVFNPAKVNDSRELAIANQVIKELSTKGQ